MTRAAAIVAAALVVGACSGDGRGADRDGGDQVTSVPVTQTADPGSLDPDLVTLRARLRPAVEALLAAPAVRIEGRETVDQQMTTLEAVVRPAETSFDSTEHLPEGVGYRRVLIGDQLYVRVETGTDDPAFSASPIEGAEYLAGVFTFHGRMFDDLEALIAVVETVPFSVDSTTDATGIHGYTLTASAEAVLEALVDLGIEQAGAVDPHGVEGEVRLVVRLGEVLVGVEGSGVVFHDAEPVASTVTLRYDVAPDAPVVTTPSGL